MAHIDKQTSFPDHSSPQHEYLIPVGLKKCQFKRRIAMSPMGISTGRPWPGEKWIALASVLREQGWQVAFIVPPPERALWLKLTRGEFEIPLLRSTSEVASYIYQSAALLNVPSEYCEMAKHLGCPSLTVHSTSRIKGILNTEEAVHLDIGPRFKFIFPVLSVSEVYHVVLELIDLNAL